MLLLVAMSIMACKEEAPQVTVTDEATEMERVFDEFPENEFTFSDDFSTLDDDLALS